MLKNKKILVVLSILISIIIAGLIVIFLKGMNYSLIFGENTSIELYLDTEFESADVQSIVTEVFGNEIKTMRINNLEKDILIITKTVSDEQLETLISKANEKYSLELTTDDLIVTNNTKISGMDLIRPYILPACITMIGILIYFIIRYKKLGVYKIFLSTLITIVLVQLLMLSIYAITRLPINEYTMPISMMLYLVSIILLVEKYDKELLGLKKEQK